MRFLFILIKICSGKVGCSILVSYVRLADIQGSCETKDQLRFVLYANFIKQYRIYMSGGVVVGCHWEHPYWPVIIFFFPFFSFVYLFYRYRSSARIKKGVLRKVIAASILLCLFVGSRTRGKTNKNEFCII